MKKIQLLFLLCSSFMFTQGQESYLKYNSEIGIFNTTLNSKTIFNSNSFWDNNFKEKLINNIKETEHFHFIGNADLSYYNKNGWSLSYLHKTLIFSTITNDLIKIGLFGNTTYTGEKLKFAPSFIEGYRYSEMQFGYQWNKNLHITASAIVGHQFLSLKLNKADFFTEENINYINYDLQMELHFSDSTLSDFFDANGYGAAFGIHYRKKINENIIELSATDIGFILWDEDCTNLHVDTNYHFEGLQVNDLFNFNADLFNKELDNVQKGLEKPIQESYTWQIPILLSSHYYHQLSINNFSGISVGTKYRLNIYPKPFMYANIHGKRKNSEWSIGYHNGGMEYAGIQFSYGFKHKNTYFYLYTKQANLFLPEEIYGLHIGFTVKKVFLSKN